MNGRAGGRILVGALLVGWLVGLAIQVATRLQTGYMDIYPPHMLIGVLLSLGAGAVAYAHGSAGHTVRRGALAGIAMIGSIVAGYAVLTVVLWNPAWSEQGPNETWFSLLIEAPFWIGLPTLVGAGLGALGWLAARRVGATRPEPR